jgi:hypothetical protein
MIILMDTCGGQLRFDELYASFGFRKPRHRRAKVETAPMTDQNRLNTFNQAVTAAKGRHQQAVKGAHEEFNTAISKADRERDDLYKAASEAWDAVKSNPNHPDHDEAWVALEQAKAQANHGPAHRALEAALRQADQNYHAELAELGRTHGVSVR